MLPFLLGILHIIVEMLVMKFRVDVHTTKINKILSSIMIVFPDHPFFLIPISMLKNRLTAKKLMTINYCYKCKWIPYYMIGVSQMPTEDQGQEKKITLIHTDRNWKDKWQKLDGILK